MLSKLHCLVIVMQGHYLFWVWIALMRTLLIKVLIHENVTEFGDAEIRLHLADLYVILRLELSPVQVWLAKPTCSASRGVHPQGVDLWSSSGPQSQQ